MMFSDIQSSTIRCHTVSKQTRFTVPQHTGTLTNTLQGGKAIIFVVVVFIQSIQASSGVEIIQRAHTH